MKILIIETTWMGGAKLSIFNKLLLTGFSILPTLYARQLAAITPKKHTVTIVNERYEKIPFDQHYDIVNINCTTGTVPRAYELTDIFRKKGITVILSGLHPSAIPDEAKQHADSVLLGRGEFGWLNLLEDYEYKRLQPFYQPIPPSDAQRIPPTNVTIPGFVVTGAIEATRGCPYQCDFCPDANLPRGSLFYARPVEDVIAEIKMTPQKTIMFYDASLTINPTYTKELFRQMKGLHKKFFCNGNVDVLACDEELVRLSKEAGCVAWLVGFESVSQQTLDAVGKKTNNVDDYAQVVHTIHAHRMAVIGCFMFGFDTDTPDVFDETLRIINKLKIDVADFCILTPFPGTPLYTQLDHEGRIITRDWGTYNMKNVVFTPKHMTPEELYEGVKRMYRDYYTLPATVQRVAVNLKRGFYPFFVVLFRSIVAYTNKQLLCAQKKDGIPR